jgi:signal transduction histidine kinase
METASGTPGVLPHLRLDELLAELQSRLQAVLTTRDRMHGLLEAVVTIGSGLDLETTLRRIVEAAVGLVDAKYGALGMISEGQRLLEFIPVGLEETDIKKIDHWPEGRGLLGLLIDDPRPLRLADISQHPESSGFPEGHPPMGSFLGVPIRGRDTVVGNLYLTEKRDGGEFTEEDEAVVTALGAAAGVAIENARLYDEARRQQRWLRASAEVTTSLLSGTDPGEVLASLTRQVRELSGADFAWFSMQDEEGLRHTIEYAEGEDAEEARGLVVPADRSLAQRVILSGEPLTLDDLTGSGDIDWLERDPAGQVDHVMAFPLGPPGNVRGVLHAGRRRGGLPFPAAMADLVASFAAQAGVALELAARRQDKERLSLFEDRDRIARDLHDLVIQRLYATGMSLEGTVPMITKPEVTNRIHGAVDSMDETIKDIRATIFALQSRAEDRPPNLRGEIVGIVDQMTPMLGFSPSLRLGQGLSGPVAADAAEYLLTALREALSNAARHAHATRVDVSADVDAAGNLTLRVVDNGAGIPPDVHRGGLRNLARRAEKLGGELRLDPADATGTGTELVWRVPCDHPAGRL